MMLRFSVSFIAVTCAANLASAQLPIANPVMGSAHKPTKEWKVSYDVHEDLTSLGFSRRPMSAIRMQMRQDPNNNTQYQGRIFLFQPATTGMATHALYGKTEWFALNTAGGDNMNRLRVGFRTQAMVDVKSGTTTVNQIHVSGIWQHGRATGQRVHERLQIKVHYQTAPPAWHVAAAAAIQAPPVKPAAGAGSRSCEDDPDTDVLEEGTPPGGDSDSESEPTSP